MTYKQYNSRTGFFKDIIKNVQKEIINLPKNELLNLDETEYIDYLYEKYHIEPISVIREKEEIQQPEKIKREVKGNPYASLYSYGRRNTNIIHEGYRIDVKYSFTGDPRLFFVKPNSFSSRGPLPKLIVDDNQMCVILSYECWNMDPDEFNDDKIRGFDNTIGHLLTINSEVETFNRELKDKIKREFHEIKEECLKENSFFKAINVKPHTGLESKLIVPIVKKKLPSKPSIKEESYTYYPLSADEMYESIIGEINLIGRSWEQLPSIYKGKGEEALRDLFLSHLSVEYKGLAATGETFNKSGKTDICIKDPDSNQNLFIAECKIWNGASLFHKAINQLFDLYLTVRDSKVALIIFVKNREFNSVIETIKKETPKHPYYISSRGQHNDTSFSYTFSLPDDEEQHVKVEIILFHFPMNNKKEDEWRG